MAIPTYTPGYPPDGFSLGNTKAVIRDNLDGTFQTLNVDHVNNNGSPGSNPAGYHTVIHEVTQSSVSTVSGINQLFSGIPGTLIVNGVTTPAIPADGNPQFYSLSGAAVGLSGLSQLTGNSSLQNGYQYIGGVLLQWGVLVFGSRSGTINFITSNINFNSNCFTVFTTLTGSSSAAQDISITSISKTSFGYSFSGGSSSSYTGFYWLAIGN